MNVRTTTTTTLSLIVFIVGLGLLIPLIQRSLPYEVWRYFEARSQSIYYVGGFHGFMTKTAMWLVIIVGIVDAILKERKAHSLLYSLNIPIVVGITIMMFVFTSVNDYIFWGLCYISTIVGVYWTFRKIIGNNQSGGQKLIPFIKGIKVGVGTGMNHISDRYTVYGTALVLIAFFALLLGSFAIYMMANWNIFT